MKQFDYENAKTIGEAVNLLNNSSKNVRPIAGGTDLIPRMRNGLLEPDILVDIKNIPELNILSINGDLLEIGAAVPLYRIYEEERITKSYPALIDAIKNIGGIAIQGRATVGGNLCNAAPSGDSIPALIVHEAMCIIAGPTGQRILPVEDFCTAPGKTALGRGELLTTIQIKHPPHNTGSCYNRFIPRNEMDIAVTGVAASLMLSMDRTQIENAKVAIGAVAPTPLLVKAAGEVLVGNAPTEEAWGKAAIAAQSAARPITDVRGSINQRKHLVGVLTKRALRKAYLRAIGEMEI
ncbi:MAG: hypothetical protein QG670_191 [Thermoproteota archaeon]|nr:hypothetical protein [Thermoproteota archaeon]